MCTRANRALGRSMVRAGAAASIAATALTLIALLVPTDSRAAGWLPPVDVPGTSGGSSSARVGVDAQGNVYAVWVESGSPNEVRASKRPVGGSFENFQTLDQSVMGGLEAGIGVDDAGNAVAVWRNPDTPEIKIARRAAGASAFGAPEPPLSLTNLSESSVQMAVSGKGKLALAWISNNSGDPAIRTAVGSTTGTITVQDPPYAFPSNTVGPPRVAIDDAGDAVAAWATGSSGTAAIETGYRAAADAGFSPGGLQSPPNDSNTSSFSPNVAIDPAGNALVTWRSFDADGTLLAAYRDATPMAPTWAALADFDGSDQGFEGPAIGFDGGGNAVAGWNNLKQVEVRASLLPPGASAFDTPPLVIAGATESASGFSGAPAPGGGFALAWTQTAGDQPARAVVRPPGGPFGPVATLSAAGHSGGGPSAALDSGGGGAALWFDSDTGGSRLASAVYDANGPSLTSVDVPATGTAGAPVTVAAAATDDWSQPSLSWNFGDGTASGSGSSLQHAYAAAGSYTVTVTAADAVGQTASATRTIDVAAAPVVPPVIPPPDTPTRGVDFNASTVSGQVLVSVPENAPAGRVLARPVVRGAAAIAPPAGYLPFRVLGKDDNIPVGSILDASKGVSSITMAANAPGTVTQTGKFSQGVFKTSQSTKVALTTAVMMGGGNFRRDCRATRAGKSGASTARRKPGRRLFGNVKGRFRTRGRNSTATVRGTQYLVKDSCRGTLTTVRRGSVRVFDLVKRKGRTVKAGKSYLARPKSALKRRGG